jgi:hypothetical protein
VEPDALNAIMRLCLRLTRDWQLAAMFAELGGIRLLLALTQVNSTPPRPNPGKFDSFSPSPR